MRHVEKKMKMACDEVFFRWVLVCGKAALMMKEDEEDAMKRGCWVWPGGLRFFCAGV